MNTRLVCYLQMASSGLFLFGSLMPVICYSIAFFRHYELNHLGAKAMEGIAWTVLAGHVLPEIVIDLNTFPKSARKFPHMRYSTRPCPNFLQSMAFGAACILQGFYYSYMWSDDVNDETSEQSYEIINCLAGHVWLAAGIVAYTSGGTPGFRYDCKKGTRTVLLHLANDCFLVSMGLLFLAGYIWLYSDTAGIVIHGIVRVLWTLIALIFFIDDIIQTVTLSSRRLTDQKDSSSTPLAPSKDQVEGPNNA